jgi:hypothetical protein
VLAIIGGVLAFKTSRNLTPFFCNTTTTPGGPLVCQTVTLLRYTTIPNGQAPVLLPCTTRSLLNSCPIVTFYPIQEI